MTSDAKIGLLLGLVFIFIIAFVINGLPRFRNNSSELTTNMVSSSDTLGIGSNERKAQEVLSWPEQDNKKPSEEIQTPIEEKENVRFKMQLPEDIPVAKDTSFIEIPEEVEPTIPESTGPILTESVQPISTEPARPTVTKPAIKEIIEAKKPEPVRPAGPDWPKSYVVAEDDSLGLVSIAKKFYGPEQGNKRINIDRIFEANRGILKSPNEIYVGQKIMVPPSAASDTETKETGGTFTDLIFETVKSIGRKNPSSSSDTTTQTVPYVVRDGDYLWRIAVEQLGDGSRYKEISKLNANIIKNENDLEVGTLLRIPVK